MPENMKHILVIDTGGAGAGRICKKLRALGVAALTRSAADFEITENTAGIIACGNGFMFRVDEGAVSRMFEGGLPLLALGACFEGVIAFFGGIVQKNRSDGQVMHVTFGESRLFLNLTSGDRCLERLPDVTLPEGWTAIAEADGIPCAFQNNERNIFGAFFTVESGDPDGLTALENFARGICQCPAEWSMEAFLERAVLKMRADHPAGTVVVGLSGGLMSTVTAFIARCALGERAKPVLCDTGLLPADEMECAARNFPELTVKDISEEVFSLLESAENAREKRECVMKAISRALSEAGEYVLTGTGNSPVEGLFRDEVRALGGILGLNESYLTRRPFPDAGFAARIAGRISKEKIDCIRSADEIFVREIRAANLDKKLWQYYALLTETEKGVYVVLNALISSEPFGGYAFRLPYDVIERTVMAILEESRLPEGVLYDVSGCRAPIYPM